MKSYLLVAITLFLMNFCYAQIPVPLETPKMISGTNGVFPNRPDAEKTQQSNSEILDEYKDLVWNKWDTENFVVLSIDKKQGVYIKNNVENIKTWILNRWGMSDISFSSQCKIVCVNNRDLFIKLFKIDKTHCEIRKNSDGKISLSAIWLCYDDFDEISYSLSGVCFSEMEQITNKKIPLHLKTGMCYLNKSVEEIKDELAQSDEKINYEEIVSKKQEDLDKNKSLFGTYEKQSAILCLLFRKEYGQHNYLNYLADNDLGESFGTDNPKIIKEILNRYNENLLKDLKQNNVPNDYLNIRRK